MTYPTRKLGDVCHLIKGRKPKNFVSKSNKQYLTAKVVRKTEEPQFVHENCPSSVWVKKEDIVIIMDGSNSGEMFTGLEGALASTMGIIRYPKDLLTAKYLLHFLVTHRENFTKSRTGSAIPHLNKEEFENLEIPLPPLPEQHRIVKILDEAFANIEKAKANTEKNLQNSRELFESYLQSVFAKPKGDREEKSLKEVCVIQSKLIDPRKPEFLDLIHVGAGNIEIKTGKLINLKTSREEKLISGKFQFDPSMVLYSKIRPYLMKVVRPNFQGLCSADIYPLLPNKKLMIRDYLFYLLLTPVFTGFAIKGSARAGMPKVNRDHLFTFNFFLPPISEQKAIVKKLDTLADETKKLEAIYQQKLDDLAELKKSILKKAFAGEL